MSVSGNAYETNDHVAFAQDLETINRMGLHIVPLATIATELAKGSLNNLRGCVGISFDDGSDFDWHDLPHPTWGLQRSMANIIEDFRIRHGPAVQPNLAATSFAIVSPDARSSLDRTCMIGCGWWNDDWWLTAESSGLLQVECHSWDHNHPTLDQTATVAPRGTFEIRRPDEAEAEIGVAAAWLRTRRGREGAVLFAYPYGQVSEYLERAWLPEVGEHHGLLAAFSSDVPEPVTSTSSRWRIPRFVFGDHWRSSGQLEELLRENGQPGNRARKSRPTVERTGQHESWRKCLKTWETTDARAVAGDLFRRSFGHEIPDYPRHFVLVYSPPREEKDRTPKVVAYVHQSPLEDIHLTGGMCVDAGAYKKMPRWLFEQVREQGGLATIVTRDSIDLLGDSVALFGHVGEPRARAADLRTGFVDTDVPHLMVLWMKQIGEDEKKSRIARVAKLGPF